MSVPQPGEARQEARDAVEDEWEVWGKSAYDFLKSHAGGAIYPTPDPKMDVTEFNAQIRVMVQTYFCLCKFVNFYPTFARSNAARTRLVFPPPNGMGQRVRQSQEWPPLTNTELLRLQRGLLRYEMCCRLIGLASIAVTCDYNVASAMIYNPHSDFMPRVWASNPFFKLLPVDEVEEIFCATTYVRDLYDSLRWKFVTEFPNHLLSVDQGRGHGVHGRDGSDTRKTAGYWLSQGKSQILGISSLAPGRLFDWKESMSRLGLVFLDRVTRSTLQERREIMRNTLNMILGLYEYRLIGAYADDITHVSRAAEGLSDGFGPHCNSMIWTSCSNSSITELIHTDYDLCRLRRLGWAFFDDKSRLRSLGLPRHTGASTIRGWLKRAENRRHTPFPLRPKIPDSALAALFTEKEWEELVMDRYSPKDRRYNYQAMSQFVTDVRAVVDFTSTQLPHID